MIHNYTTIVALASSIFASGCAGISGLGGTSSFACKAPDGVRCDSLLGIYHNSLAHNLPGQRNGTRGPGVQHGDEKMQAVANRIMSEYPPHVVATQDVLGKPIRSQSTTLRIWFAPYQDSDGDLNDASYAYVVTGQGEWMVDHSLPLLKDMPRGSATSKPTSAPKELVKPKTVSAKAGAFVLTVFGLTNSFGALVGLDVALPRGISLSSGRL